MQIIIIIWEEYIDGNHKCILPDHAFLSLPILSYQLIFNFRPISVDYVSECNYDKATMYLTPSPAPLLSLSAI